MVRVGHQEPRVEADVGGGGVLRGEGGWKSAEGELEQESSGEAAAGMRMASVVMGPTGERALPMV